MTLVCEKCLKEHDEMALIKLSHPYTRGDRSGYLAGMRKMRDIVDFLIELKEREESLESD